MPFAILFAAVGPLAALYLGFKRNWTWTPRRFAFWSLALCFILNFFALLVLFVMNVRIVDPYRVGNLVKYIAACLLLTALVPPAYKFGERNMPTLEARFRKIANIKEGWSALKASARRRVREKYRDLEGLRGQPFRVVIKRPLLSRVMDWLLVTTALVFYLLLIRKNTYWYDEVWSVMTAKLDYSAFIGNMIGDVHPPLFYFPLYAIIHLFGVNDVLIKLMTVIPWFIALLAGIFFVKKNFGRGAMYFYVLALSCLPVFMNYALETRMYSLALCLCIYSGIALNRLLKNPSHGNFLLFSILALLAAYTHYYALITVAFLYLGALIFFLARKNARAAKRWIGYGALMVLGYSPWIPVFFGQIKKVSGGYWIQAYPVSSYLNTFFGDANRFGLIIPAILALCFVWIIVSRRKTASENAWWSLICVGSFAGILLFGAAYELLIQPLLFPRYLIMALGLTILGASAAFGTMKRPFIPWLVCLVLLTSGFTFWPKALNAEQSASQATMKTQAFVAENALDGKAADYIDSGGNTWQKLVFEYYIPGVPVEAIKPEDLNLSTIGKDGLWLFANAGAFEETGIPASGLKYERFEGYGFEAINFDIYHVWRDPPAG